MFFLQSTQASSDFHLVKDKIIKQYNSFSMNLTPCILIISLILLLLILEIYFFLFQEASQSEIKKQYRKLSLKYHPDRETGDPVMFMKIAKAYEA